MRSGRGRARFLVLAAVAVTAAAALALAVACGEDGAPPAPSGPSGRIAFVSFRDGAQEIYLLGLDAGGEEVNLTNDPAVDIDPDWSPDGRQIVFASDRAGGLYLFVMNSDGSEVRQLTEGLGGDLSPRWSPDGSRIAFSRSGSLYVIDADGGNERMLLTSGPGEDAAPCTAGAFVGGWSPDSSRITFYALDVSRQEGQICVMGLDDEKPTVLVAEPAGIHAEPAWSSDGRFIAYRSIRDGNHDVYQVDVETGIEERITTGPGLDIEPDWSPDGRWITLASLPEGAPNFDIYIMRADGSDQRQLTTDPAKEGNPVWSP